MGGGRQGVGGKSELRLAQDGAKFPIAVKIWKGFQ